MVKEEFYDNEAREKIYFLLLLKIVGHIMNALRAPEQDLDAGEETDAKAESTEAAEVWDEVEPSHLARPLKLWKS